MLRIQVLCLAAILGGVGAFAPPGAGIALRQGKACRAVTFSPNAHAQKLKDYGYNIIDAKSGTTTLSKDTAPASMGTQPPPPAKLQLPKAKLEAKAVNEKQWLSPAAPAAPAAAPAKASFSTADIAKEAAIAGRSYADAIAPIKEAAIAGRSYADAIAKAMGGGPAVKPAALNEFTGIQITGHWQEPAPVRQARLAQGPPRSGHWQESATVRQARSAGVSLATTTLSRPAAPAASPAPATTDVAREAAIAGRSYADAIAKAMGGAPAPAAPPAAAKPAPAPLAAAAPTSNSADRFSTASIAKEAAIAGRSYADAIANAASVDYSQAIETQRQIGSIASSYQDRLSAIAKSSTYKIYSGVSAPRFSGPNELSQFRKEAIDALKRQLLSYEI